MTGDSETPVLAVLPFWLRPVSIFGRLKLTTFIKSSHTLAMSSTLAPSHLDAGSQTVSSRFRPPSCEGRIRCKRAYYPLRVRVMGHPVTSQDCA